MTDAAEPRRLLRRILVCFAIIVVLVPLVALEGAWTLALIPAVVASLVALTAALRLRRITRSARR